VFQFNWAHLILPHAAASSLGKSLKNKNPTIGFNSRIDSLISCHDTPTNPTIISPHDFTLLLGTLLPSTYSFIPSFLRQSLNEKLTILAKYPFSAPPNEERKPSVCHILKP
jgi:hypothetical protein